MEILKDIYYIGVNDEDIKIFEGQYNVPEGMSYNSYCLKDDKIVIMDTVDKSKTEEWLEKLANVLQDKEPDYLVISHLEPDHSGSIKILLDKYPNITLIGNSKTFAMLPQFFEIKSPIKKQEVKEGDTLNIGKHTLQFFMAPMVHWPEVMVTYEQTEKILFSADAFGKFGKIQETEEWEKEARRYYIGIVGKFGVPVQALLNKAKTLDIKMICPLHGPILKETLGYYIDKYNTWSQYEPEEEGVLIACASIYGNTLQAAQELEKILKEKGKKVEFVNLNLDDIDGAVASAFCYSKLILAASSYNGGVFPPMKQFLMKLQERNYQKRTIGIIENGSWAPSAAKTIKEIINKMNTIHFVEPTITIQSTIKEKDRPQLQKLAEELL